MPVRIAPGVPQERVEKELEARAPVTVERQMEETLLGLPEVCAEQGIGLVWPTVE